ERGDSEAQYRLGRAAYSALGKPRDTEAAVNWLRLAAEQLHAEAQDLLARCYFFHHVGGVEGAAAQVEAARLWQQAAAARVPSAMYSYALCLYAGYGTAQDLAAAVH